MVDGCGFMVLRFYYFFTLWSLICNYYDADVSYTNHHVDNEPLYIFLQLFITVHVIGYSVRITFIITINSVDLLILLSQTLDGYITVRNSWWPTYFPLDLVDHWLYDLVKKPSFYQDQLCTLLSIFQTKTGAPISAVMFISKQWINFVFFLFHGPSFSHMSASSLLAFNYTKTAHRKPFVPTVSSFWMG